MRNYVIFHNVVACLLSLENVHWLVGFDGTVRSLMMRFINTRAARTNALPCVTKSQCPARMIFIFPSSHHYLVGSSLLSIHFISILFSFLSESFSLSCLYFSRHKLLRVEKRSPRDLDTILRDDVESHDEYPRRSTDTHREGERKQQTIFLFSADSLLVHAKILLHLTLSRVSQKSKKTAQLLLH